MPTIKKTPPLGARGRYILSVPWQANPNKLYTCIAVRSFADIYKLGQDVYKVFYFGMGATAGAVIGGLPFNFTAESAKKPNIITLQSDDGEVIYVPDTFIQKFPDQGEVKYSHIVLSLSLGPVPDYANLEEIKQAVAETVAQRFGFSPTVREHRAPATDNPTAEQHEALEAARLGAITLLETDQVKVLRLIGVNDKQRDVINTLSNVLRTHNIPPFD